MDSGLRCAGGECRVDVSMGGIDGLATEVCWWRVPVAVRRGRSVCSCWGLQGSCVSECQTMCQLHSCSSNSAVHPQRGCTTLLVQKSHCCSEQPPPLGLRTAGD